jgi:hypothetical protein
MVSVSVSGVWSRCLDIYMGPTAGSSRGILFNGRCRKGGVENTLSAVLYADFIYHCDIVYCGGSANPPQTNTFRSDAR